MYMLPIGPRNEKPLSALFAGLLSGAARVRPDAPRRPADSASACPSDPPNPLGMRSVYFTCALTMMLALAAPALARDEQPDGPRLPALSGSTGFVDVPAAYTMKRHRGMVALQVDHVDASGGWWPNVYRGVKADATRLHAVYGVATDTEVNLTVEDQNHELHYNDPVFGTDPDFHTDGKLFFGVGGKRAFQVQPHVWAAVGGRWQAFDQADRSITELHEYERFSHLFASTSWQAREDLFVHGMLKYVIYDFQGGRPASGATAVFPGFSLPASWLQPGVAVEWRPITRWSVAGEFVADTRVDFLGGVPKNAVNATVRYEGAGSSFGLFAKRLNQSHLLYLGGQAGVSF